MGYDRGECIVCHATGNGNVSGEEADLCGVCLEELFVDGFSDYYTSSHGLNSNRHALYQVVATRGIRNEHDADSRSCCDRCGKHRNLLFTYAMCNDCLDSPIESQSD